MVAHLQRARPQVVDGVSIQAGMAGSEEAAGEGVQLAPEEVTEARH